MPNICLWWHVCACTTTRRRTVLHDTQNSYKCSRCKKSFHHMHYSLVLMWIIRHSMSKLLKCWETKCQWSMSMYDKTNSYQKAAFRGEEAVFQLSLTTPHSLSVSPRCFRLLLWQSSGICLQNSCAWHRKLSTLPRTLCPLLDFLLWWKCINLIYSTRTVH